MSGFVTESEYCLGEEAEDVLATVPDNKPKKTYKATTVDPLTPTRV